MQVRTRNNNKYSNSKYNNSKYKYIRAAVINIGINTYLSTT